MTIWDYVDANDGAAAALRVHDRFRLAFVRLADTPQLGHERPDLTSKPVKFYRVGSHFVMYDPRTRPLEILRVIHTARDVQRVLISDNDEAS